MAYQDIPAPSFPNLERLIDNFQTYVVSRYHGKEEQAGAMFTRLKSALAIRLANKNARAAFGEVAEGDFSFSEFNLAHSIGDQVDPRYRNGNIIWHWNDYIRGLSSRERRQLTRSERRALNGLMDITRKADATRYHPERVSPDDAVAYPLTSDPTGPKANMPYVHEKPRLSAFAASLGTSILLGGVSRYALMAGLGFVGSPLLATALAASGASVIVGGYMHYRRNRQEIERTVDNSKSFLGRMGDRWRGLRKSWGLKEAFTSATTGAVGGVIGFEVAGFMAENNVGESLKAHLAEKTQSALAWAQPSLAPIAETLAPAVQAYVMPATDFVTDRLSEMHQVITSENPAEKLAQVVRDASPHVHEIATAGIEAPLEAKHEAMIAALSQDGAFDPETALAALAAHPDIEDLEAAAGPGTPVLVLDQPFHEGETQTMLNQSTLPVINASASGPLFDRLPPADIVNLPRVEDAVPLAVEGANDPIARAFADAGEMPQPDEQAVKLVHDYAQAYKPVPVGLGEASGAIEEQLAAVSAVASESAAAALGEAFTTHHTVASGDRLWELAEELRGISSNDADGHHQFIRQIMQANPELANPNDLKIGQVLIIPPESAPEADCRTTRSGGRYIGGCTPSIG